MKPALAAEDRAQESLISPDEPDRAARRQLPQPAPRRPENSARFFRTFVHHDLPESVLEEIKPT
jgi:hypothetical protein